MIAEFNHCSRGFQVGSFLWGKWLKKIVTIGNEIAMQWIGNILEWLGKQIKYIKIYWKNSFTLKNRVNLFKQITEAACF